MQFTTSEPKHPRLTLEKALAQVKETGYVRMDGHTATSEDQLRHLYDVIFAAKDDGTYGLAQDGPEARKAYLTAAGQPALAETTGGQAVGDSKLMEALADFIRNEVVELRANAVAAQERIAELEQRDAKADVSPEADEELKKAREELESLRGQISSSKDLETMAETAMSEAEQAKKDLADAQKRLDAANAEIETLRAAKPETVVEKPAKTTK